jgi:hypothetical protein
VTYLWTQKHLRNSLLNAQRFTPASVSAITSWHRVPLATVTGSGISSLPDVLNSNPAVQATDAARPPRVASAGNGLLVMQGVNDRLSIPAISGNNQLVTWGFATHILLDDVAATKYILRRGVSTGTEPVATDSDVLTILSDESLFFRVHADASGGQIRSAATPAGTLTNAAYRFVTVEFNGNLAAEANRCVITVDAAVQTLSFANSVGTPGAMPAALQGQPAGTDISLLDQRTNAGLSPFIGKMGPNIYFLGAAMPGVTAGLLTPTARAALMNFERPT